MIARTCPKCVSPLAPQARFCPRCGVRVYEQLPPPVPTAFPPAPPAAKLDPSWNNPNPNDGVPSAMTVVAWFWVIIVLIFFLALAIS